MNIAIESHVLNHHRRSGMMTYTEGLVNYIFRNDLQNRYNLLFYSLRRSPQEMPGPSGENVKKFVLRMPDNEFRFRQQIVDHLFLPGFLKRQQIKIFHRVVGYTMPRVKGVFKVLTVHDLRTLTIGDDVWQQNMAHYKKTLSDVDACVVVSECTKKDLLDHFQLNEKKIHVVHLAADQHFRPAKAEDIAAVRQKYQINGPFLLSIGSVPRKNIDGIIRAFAASDYKDKFTLVSSCNIGVEKYRQLAQELGVADRVKILDKLNDTEVIALFTDCHCFVFPSLYEGFGLPILEAMQCGTPVITSNISSCPEVTGDAAILVNPNVVQEIGEAINQICGNEHLRKYLIAKGFQQAKKFNWDTFTQEMMKIYALA